jgi:hypothetical protein
MPETIGCGQENDIQCRSLVLGRARHLHQDVQGHQNTTYPTRSCPGPACIRINMLSNHIARLQHHLGQGQEEGVHTLWFPCRVLLDKGYCSSQTRRDGPTQFHISDGLIPQS